MRLKLSDLSDCEIEVKWKMLLPLIVYFTCTKILERIQKDTKHIKDKTALKQSYCFSSLTLLLNEEKGKKENRRGTVRI